MKTPKLMLLLLSIVLIYDFDTTFDRGLKVRLFCSPQWVQAMWTFQPIRQNCQPRIKIEILRLPNDDFGRPNKLSGASFRRTFLLGSYTFGVNVRMAWTTLSLG